MEEHFTLKVKDASKRVTLTYIHDVRVDPDVQGDYLDFYGAILELDQPEKPVGEKAPLVRKSYFMGQHMRQAALERYQQWSAELYRAVNNDPVHFAVIWAEIRKAELAGKGS